MYNYQIKYNKVLNSLILSFILIVVTISCKKIDTLNKNTDSHFTEFSNRWSLYLESSYGGWKNNKQGRFSWDDAYALDGLIFHFERSRDMRYLDTFFKVASKIMNSNDIQLAIKDKYRGNRILHGWSSSRYTNDSSNHIFGVTDAMILYPIIKLYNLLNKNASLDFSKKYFLDSALNFSIIEFEEIQRSDWIDQSIETGYFQDCYYSNIGIITPVNQYAKIGSYAIELYKATGNKLYLSYVNKIATHLAKNLKYYSDFFYWNYIISTSPQNNDLPDDLGHSILVTEFIINCYKNKIVFNYMDIQHLINLFKHQIHIENTLLFREYLLGNSISSDPFISHYYLLSEFDTSVYNLLSRWYIQQNFILDKNSFLNHFGNKLILLDALETYFRN